MSRNQEAVAALKASREAAKARLTAQNKEQARAHLLQVQLLLARRPIVSSK
jgi:hypothetical protein